MPELAEVALFAHDLNTLAKKGNLLDVTFPNQKDWGGMIVPRRAQRCLRELLQKRVSFRSFGKALFLHAAGNESPLLEIRLGMTGQFHLERKPGKWKRHYFLTLQLGTRAVYYADPRRFGRIREPGDTQHALGGYCEQRGFWRVRTPLLPNGYLSRSRMSWLLGTGDATGVGNYMANEALGRLGLSPFEPFSNSSEASAALRMCASIASQSYRHGGHSFGTGYFRLDGTEGIYARACRFYKSPAVGRATYQGRPVYSHFVD